MQCLIVVWCVGERTGGKASDLGLELHSGLAVDGCLDLGKQGNAAKDI